MSPSPDLLFDSQSRLSHKISRVMENLKKRGWNTITRGKVQAALEELQDKWTRYKANHENLQSLSSKPEVMSHVYFVEDRYSSTEDDYIDQKGMLLDLLSRFQREQDAATTSATVNTSQRSEKDCSHEARKRVSLPRIPLPTFSGQFHEWQAFRDLFRSLVVNEPSISDVEKLFYLKTSLSGEAELLVHNLPATGENFQRAWDTLTGRFENTRLLLQTQLSRLFSISPMLKESSSELKRLLYSTSDVCGILEGMDQINPTDSVLLVYLTVSRLDKQTRREWESYISDQATPPKFPKLKTFLDQRIIALEAIEQSLPSASRDNPKAGSSSKPKQVAHATQRESADSKCGLCQKNHFLLYCNSYRKQKPDERRSTITALQRCINCLGPHSIGDCRSPKRCQLCEGLHHTTIHTDTPTPESVATVAHVASSSDEILLATAVVFASNPGSEKALVRALIDTGSEVSLITESLAQRLLLQRHKAPISIIGVGSQRSVTPRGRVSLRISPYFDRDVFYQLNALVLPRITNYQTPNRSESSLEDQMKGLVLADPSCYANRPIELLLGADIYATLLRVGVRRLNSNALVAQQTGLGWIVSGVLPATSACSDPSKFSHCASLHVSLDRTLQSLVERFWDQEEVEVPLLQSAEDKQCEQLYAKTHFRNSEGRYTVRLPFKDGQKLGSSYPAAQSMLFCLERRFERSPDLKTSYSAFMEEYETLSHMTPLTRFPSGEHFFLPHHGVIRESSSTTKLRVVFNGSRPTSNGRSLNENLFSGPNLLPDLEDLILRWRLHRYVITADVEKMYRQILVHPSDRDHQLILWRQNKNQTIRLFQLNTVTYGLVCAPFLAIRTLHQLASDESLTFPAGSVVLRRDVYMDDVLTGASTVGELRTIQTQLDGLCRAGGFHLRKWCSNVPELIPEDNEANNKLPCDRDREHLVLGIHWNTDNDMFKFQIRDLNNDSPVTKRFVLSEVARIFDPLGWLAPVTVRAKIFLQSLWLLKIDWDAALPESEVTTWTNFRSELLHLKQVEIPRWLNWSESDGSMELHGFCDASERAYAANLYLLVRSNQTVSVRLITAKTKVAPLKRVSLPRLELAGAYLLTRLTKKVQLSLPVDEESVHLWSDSRVTLSWIQGHPARWKTYVANRVAEIQRLLPLARWHHVRSADNPADCASRGVSPKSLLSLDLWWNGPSWLKTSSTPAAPSNLVEEFPPCIESELRSPHCSVVSTPPNNDVLLHFSNFQRLLRFTAWSRRWLKSTGENQLNLTTQEIREAQNAWMKLVQAEHYAEELTCLRKQTTLPTRSSLQKLNPFIDEEGLLRVGGRLGRSNLDFTQRHPCILPTGSHLTLLAVRHTHTRCFHGGVQLTLATLRQNFWVVRGRQVVKSLIHNCVICVRWKAITCKQLMGHLPSSRVQESRPFLHVGVDYAGPILVKSARGRGIQARKGYICVFICLATKALHLEAVSDGTSQAFLSAFKRLVARRGLCRTIFSDCGSNFVGANKELETLRKSCKYSRDLVHNQISNYGVTWKFNPPSAPHFGGIWEAAVKSVKHHLRRVIGERKLTFEEFATFLCEVEACLNSRPLQPLSDDPDDVSALTPGHFLIGTPLTAIPEPTYEEIVSSRLSNWQLLTQMRQHFWKRWSGEYLNQLQTRNKWRQAQRSLAIGDLCLIKSENLSPTSWPLCRVVQVHPDSSGTVRVAKVRTAHAEILRPVVKLILLPVNSESLKSVPTSTKS